MTGVGTRGRTESHWLRLRVENARGKRSAEDVEVLLVEVRGGSRGPRLGGVPLVWAEAGSRDEYVTRLTLPPGLPRRVLLLAVVEPPDDPLNLPPVVEGETDATAELQVWPAPADGRHKLGSGEYELILAVVARDTGSREYRVKVTHDGKWWTAGQIKEHLRGEPPKRLSRRRRALEAGTG